MKPGRADTTYNHRVALDYISKLERENAELHRKIAYVIEGRANGSVLQRFEIAFGDAPEPVERAAREAE